MSNVRRPDAGAPLAGDALAATVEVIVQELTRRGFDAASLLTEAGLDRATMAHAFGRYPRDRVIAFVALANAAAGDSALHVHASLAAEIGIFRVADALAVMSPTIGLGLRAAMAQFAFVNSGVHFAIHEQPRRVDCELRAIAEPHPHPLEVACTFMVIECRVRGMTRGAFGLDAIDLRQPLDAAGEAMQRAVRTANFRFDRPLDRASFGRSTWEQSPLLAHPAVAALARATMNTPSLEDVHNWLVAVETSIRNRLGADRVGAGDIAEALGTSERSLQRRLQEHGTSYSSVLDRVRQSEALRLLRRAGDGIEAIALQLGYSETSAFTRAFRRWTGRSPSAWLRSSP